jgi:hypothetical protein
MRQLFSKVRSLLCSVPSLASGVNPAPEPFSITLKNLDYTRNGPRAAIHAWQKLEITQFERGEHRGLPIGKSKQKDG